MQHYTTIEQSKKLVELGLNLDTADMQWFLEDDYGIVQIKEDLSDWGGDCAISCWSLGALLEVMPNGVQINSNNTGISIDITFIRNGVVIDTHRVKNNTFLEAAYDMVVWLLENGYIKKEK